MSGIFKVKRRFLTIVSRLAGEWRWKLLVTRKRVFWISAACLALVACQDGPETSMVVTRIIMQQDEQIIVTRVVRQTVQIAVTPIVEEPEEPVVLDISLAGDFQSLDPQLSIEDNAVDIMENIYAGLTRYNLATDTIEPELAIRWQISDDGKTWTFDLREDVFWLQSEGNGGGLIGDDENQYRLVRAVTADDVVYSIQRSCDPRFPTPDVFILFIIEGCERVNGLAEIGEGDLELIGARAVDEHTLEINLTKPASHFLSMTSMWLLRPVPAELVEEMGEDWHLPENLWTSGPFALGPGTVKETRTVLQRNPYWPADFTGNVDLVNISHLDPMDAYLLWEDRNLDMSPVPAEGQLTILSRNELKSKLVSNQSVFYLAYNFDSPAFSYPEIRQAFGWAIDRERLIREVLGDQALPMRHFGPPGVVGAPPIDQVGTGYSPDRARLMMDSSIYGDCRLMPPITYLVSSSDLALQQAQLLREMWMEELGCNEEQIIIEQVQFGNLLANTRQDAGANRPDLWDLGWASYYPDENNWLGDVLHCDDSENRQKRPCSSVDEKIRQANDDMPIADRWDLYREIERDLFGEEAIEPISPLYVRADYVLSHGWVSFVPASFGGEQFDTYHVAADVKALERNR